MTPPSTVRVLVAEDNADVAELLKALIAMDPGLECVGAVADADGVRKALVLHVPAVMLLDLELQGVSGIRVLQECRHDHPDVTVLIVSGHSSPAVIRAAKEAGAADFLVKPDDLPVLAERIRQALSAATPTIG